MFGCNLPGGKAKMSGPQSRNFKGKQMNRRIITTAIAAAWLAQPSFGGPTTRDILDLCASDSEAGEMACNMFFVGAWDGIMTASGIASIRTETETEDFLLFCTPDGFAIRDAMNVALGFYSAMPETGREIRPSHAMIIALRLAFPCQQQAAEGASAIPE